MAKQLQRGKGSGSVFFMGKRRRNPWRAVKTTGWEYNADKEKLVQKRVTIGYFPTKDDALKALLNYNDSPYDIKAINITFAEVYEKWSEEYFPTLSSSSSTRTIICAYNYCAPLHNMRMKDIRVEHLEGAIRDADVGSATKSRMKSLFNMMYRYALRHEIVEKDYASLCNTVKKEAPQKEAIPFTSEEISLLWDNLNEIPFTDMILIGIYSGWRPQELAVLKTNDIDLKGKTMRGGLKTDAGKNRIVPIHPLIQPLIEKRYDENEEYLFNDINSTQGVGKRLSYDKYRNRFIKAMSRLKLSHRPHETRHTFITKAKSCNVDEYILKLIVGHTITDLTEKVYTHRTMEQLQKEISKIKR
ncbi:tyrosine-type recombinase/integrase [uncultured Robinsoniella sp.]|uniref:tyrosine-type recombinase/integrase n=1 Tax=uncultured Robinsoniella sp. TaxID=904190 RepID=UPI00374E69C9